MDYKDLLTKKEADLRKMLNEERGTLFDLRTKSKATPVKQHNKFKVTKRTIARILTALATLKKDQPTN